MNNEEFYAKQFQRETLIRIEEGTSLHFASETYHERLAADGLCVKVNGEWRLTPKACSMLVPVCRSTISDVTLEGAFSYGHPNPAIAAEFRTKRLRQRIRERHAKG
jgi:hypothetical protein